MDPRVVVRAAPNNEGFEGEGGWTVPRHSEDYAIVMRQWRKQTPHYEHKMVEPSEPGEAS
jgi:hypothetical protein